MRMTKHSHYAFECIDLTVTENQVILTLWCIGACPQRKEKISKRLWRQRAKFITLSFDRWIITFKVSLLTAPSYANNYL